ncbi:MULTISPECIES: TetR/AcrR family transcriptional regulator [unclassified Streptomyces]|uniref:TetR/AcrR family transcriptional regulator n=1 Tax=unclassified Streptomyces TaxID=2593676 RepID=UPI000DC7960B|nr:MULTISPECIES: TetR/AcrR family transcriptional regulator [unclassified Streptomyces]AWZ07580.1 TetR/AcrR family transcriptional regulator [Streptomyces sp. ICC4]AWZ13968.1 TetR/AcrR family transcriptional regulator [Streptomyces sp. ICC1]
MAKDPDGETGLPASLEMAWGLRERPGKGPRPTLTLPRIVDAAVALAAGEGMDAVSMGRVAKELGVSTMSLYRYVTAKEELYILMADAGVGTPPPEPSGGGEGMGWRELLSQWAYAQRTVLMMNTWILRIPITGAPVSPNQLAWMERGLAAMAGTALRESEKVSAIVLIGGLVRNEATMAADMMDAIVKSGVAPDQVLGQYVRTLRLMTGPDTHPAVTRLLESDAFTGSDEPDFQFRFGLNRILDGLAALIGERSAP